LRLDGHPQKRFKIDRRHEFPGILPARTTDPE